MTNRCHSTPIVSCWPDGRAWWRSTLCLGTRTPVATREAACRGPIMHQWLNNAPGAHWMQVAAVGVVCSKGGHGRLCEVHLRWRVQEIRHVVRDTSWSLRSRCHVLVEASWMGHLLCPSLPSLATLQATAPLLVAWLLMLSSLPSAPQVLGRTDSCAPL